MSKEEKEEFLKKVEKDIEIWKKYKKEANEKAAESKNELEHKIAKTSETYYAGGINALECLAIWLKVS